MVPMSEEIEFTHNLARKGTPNLYLAARFLKPDDKFRAFLVTYAAMRLIDDIVDDRRAAGDLTDSAKLNIISHLDSFSKMIRAGRIDDSLPYAQELRVAMGRFRIPEWPFTMLVEAMKFDLHHDRFDTMDQFLEYSEGAAVAPGSIFMHLAGCSFIDQGQVILPEFNIRDAARPLAIFSYLVHIIRDFKKDFLSGSRPLIYLNTETLETFHLAKNDLAQIAETGRQSLKFTKMVKWYYHRITDYQQQSRNMLDDLEQLLPKDGLFALNFIYELYSMIAAKISDHDYIIVRSDLNLTTPETEKAARQAATRSDIDPGPVLRHLASVLATTTT
jgi:phytoene/squalene synthetase